MITIQGVDRVELTRHIDEVRQRISAIEDKFGPGGVGGDFQATLEKEIARRGGTQNKVEQTKNSSALQTLPSATQPVNENEAANAAKIAEALKSAGGKSSTLQNNNSSVTIPRAKINPAEENQSAGITSETAEKIYGRTPERTDKAYSEGLSVEEVIETAAEKYGVDPKLAKAIATAESNMNQDVISKAGAVGVMQLMPATAASLGVDPYDREQNIEGGVKYLSQMLERFDGNVQNAVAAYNAGPNAVKKFGGIPPYSETQNYVGRVMDMYR